MGGGQEEGEEVEGRPGGAGELEEGDRLHQGGHQQGRGHHRHDQEAQGDEGLGHLCPHAMWHWPDSVRGCGGLPCRSASRYLFLPHALAWAVEPSSLWLHVSANLLATRARVRIAPRGCGICFALLAS